MSLSDIRIESSNAHTQLTSEKNKYRGLLIREGVWNGKFYPAEELEKAVSSLVGKKITYDHNSSFTSTIGKITNAWYDPSEKGIWIEFKIWDEDINAKLTKMAEDGDLSEVGLSAELYAEFELENGKYTARDISFTGATLTFNPAVDDARVVAKLKKEEKDDYPEPEEYPKVEYEYPYPSPDAIKEIMSKLDDLEKRLEKLEEKIKKAKLEKEEEEPTKVEDREVKEEAPSPEPKEEPKEEVKTPDIDLKKAIEEAIEGDWFKEKVKSAIESAATDVLSKLIEDMMKEVKEEPKEEVKEEEAPKEEPKVEVKEEVKEEPPKPKTLDDILMEINQDPSKFDEILKEWARGRRY